MQYNQAATYRVITSSIYNMRNHWFKVVEGKQKLINLKEVISKCRMVCSIYKQNQMRTMNSQDSNVVNNFNWASSSLFFIPPFCLHYNIIYMLYKYFWFCYKSPTKVTLCLLLHCTCNFHLNITSTYKLIWLLDFLLSLTELLLSVFAALAVKSSPEAHCNLITSVTIMPVQTAEVGVIEVQAPKM